MTEISIIETPNSRFLDRAGLGGFPWLTAIALYTISYGWFWNVRSSYWSDDWFSYRESGIHEIWDDYGLAPWISFYKRLYQITGPGFLRLVTFSAFFVTAICFYVISRKINYLTERLRKFATLLFLLLPFNSARISLMTFSYTVAYFFFFFAWYLVVTFKSVRIKVLAAFLFFISFQMHSLLFFVALPILHLFSLEASRNWRRIIIWFRNNWFLVLPAPIYVILRSRFWNVLIDNTYHEVKVEGLWLFSKVLVLPIIAVPVIWVLGRFLRSEYRDASRLFSLGIIAMILGLTPHIIGGYFNKPEGLPLLYLLYFLGRTREWESRHLMLQPVGATLLLTGLFSFISVKFKRLQLTLKFLSILLCVLLNVGFGFEYVTDYAKQNAVIRELQDVGYNDEVSDYVFIDKSAYLNAKGRKFSIEWQNFIDVAYGADISGSATSSTQCRSSGYVRLVVIDGEASYWKALQSWFSHRNFGFSVEISDGSNLCTLDLVENRGRQNQIPLVFYFVDAKK